MIGLKEELIGKITHNPERYQHGKKVLTGEERRKKLVGSVGILNQYVINTGLINRVIFFFYYDEPEPNPFNNIDKEDNSDNESQNQQRVGSQSRSEEGAPGGEKAVQI